MIFVGISFDDDVFDEISKTESVRNKKELSFEMVESYKKELITESPGLTNYQYLTKYAIYLSSGIRDTITIPSLHPSKYRAYLSSHWLRLSALRIFIRTFGLQTMQHQFCGISKSISGFN